MTNSEVEHGLGNMFKLESLGIEGMNNETEFDLSQIEKFKDGIELKDGKYHINLPLLPSYYYLQIITLHFQF